MLEGRISILTTFIKLEVHTFKEVWLEVDIEDIATKTFDRVIEGKNVYPLAIFYVQTLMDIDKIAKFYSQVIPGNLVHLNTTLLDVIGTQANENGITTFLSPKARCLE
jgi:hypothetical protein